MPRSQRKTGRISVFKGRKAKFNSLIFWTLALKGPKTIKEIRKVVKAQTRLRHVRYTTIRRRVGALEESGYIKRIGFKITHVGTRATIYDLTSRAYLAILLNKINLDRFIEETEDDALISALAAFVLSKIFFPEPKNLGLLQILQRIIKPTKKERLYEIWQADIYP